MKHGRQFGSKYKKSSNKKRTLKER